LGLSLSEIIGGIPSSAYKAVLFPILHKPPIMTTLVAFILGGGPGVGLHTATALKAAGYRVALASRNPNTASLTALQIHPITLDLQDPASVAPAFAAVTAALGAPNIVVYNGPTHTPQYSGV
jgi:NAD(P)-dependent dehydrogenase (short-subunit alcohol dehydrogenase family)